MSNNQKLKLGIIFGGRSPEHDVSLKSAKSIINAVDKRKYDVIPIFIDRNGKWDIKDLFSLKKHIDIAFPVLHGTFGEDGTIQGLFEIIGIPYIGAGVEASAIAMDKEVSKILFKNLNIPVVNYLCLFKKDIKENVESIILAHEKNIGYPCFIKPSNCGSSIGVTRANNKKEMICGLELAIQYDKKVLIEKAINTREIEISVLGNDDPLISVAGEIISGDEFYSFDAKYHNKESKTIVPAKISKEQYLIIGKFAKIAYKAIGCTGMARIDFFIEKDTERVYINEINTIPGFTGISMFPMLWEKSDLSLTHLIEKLTKLALERFEN